MTRKPQCTFVYNLSDGRLCCGREAAHEGPHVNVYEVHWIWHPPSFGLRGASTCDYDPGLFLGGSLLPTPCARKRGHEGPHCSAGQLAAEWYDAGPPEWEPPESVASGRGSSEPPPSRGEDD